LHDLGSTLATGDGRTPMSGPSGPRPVATAFRGEVELDDVRP
jgi:hypothetical protein